MIVSAWNSVTSTAVPLERGASASKYAFMKVASSSGDIFSASVLKPDMSVAKQVPNTTLFDLLGLRRALGQVPDHARRQIVAHRAAHPLLPMAAEQVLAHQAEQQRKRQLDQERRRDRQPEVLRIEAPSDRPSRRQVAAASVERNRP